MEKKRMETKVDLDHPFMRIEGKERNYFLFFLSIGGHRHKHA